MPRVDPDFADVLTEWGQLLFDAGIAVRLTSGYRTAEQQKRIFARLGERGLAARPGRSFHEVGLAVDFVATDPREQALAGHLGESIGLRWGGRFRPPDPVHLDAGNFISQAAARRAGYPQELVEVD